MGAISSPNPKQLQTPRGISHHTYWALMANTPHRPILRTHGVFEVDKFLFFFR